MVVQGDCEGIAVIDTAMSSFLPKQTFNQFARVERLLNKGDRDHSEETPSPVTSQFQTNRALAAS